MLETPQSSPEEAFKTSLNDLYLKCEECQEAPLVLFMLVEFSSVLQMDSTLAEGRLLCPLAKRLC